MQMRLYGISFLIAGIIMLIVTLCQFFKIRSFRDSAVIMADVTNIKQSSHYSNGRSRTAYSLVLSYNVDGNFYERELPCDAKEYDLGAGRRIEIRYKSKNPKKIISNDAEKQQRSQKILWLMTLGLIVAGALMMLVPSLMPQL